jgi:hypothetical protein
MHDDAPTCATRLQECVRLQLLAAGEFTQLTPVLNVTLWQLQLAVISSYLAMPNNPKSDASVMTVWLQVRAVS